MRTFTMLSKNGGLFLLFYFIFELTATLAIAEQFIIHEHEAHSMLHSKFQEHSRIKRDNKKSLYEEARQADNLERECIEEGCAQEEAKECFRRQDDPSIMAFHGLFNDTPEKSALNFLDYLSNPCLYFSAVQTKAHDSSDLIDDILARNKTGHDICHLENTKRCVTRKGRFNYKCACYKTTEGSTCEQSRCRNSATPVKVSQYTSQCPCEFGWKGILGDEDINECEIDDTICGGAPNTCTNLSGNDGLYDCSCSTGYELVYKVSDTLQNYYADPKLRELMYPSRYKVATPTCEDINECQQELYCKSKLPKEEYDLIANTHCPSGLNLDSYSSIISNAFACKNLPGSAKCEMDEGSCPRYFKYKIYHNGTNKAESQTCVADVQTLISDCECTDGFEEVNGACEEVSTRIDLAIQTPTPETAAAVLIDDSSTETATNCSITGCSETLWLQIFMLITVVVPVVIYMKREACFEALVTCFLSYSGDVVPSSNSSNDPPHCKYTDGQHIVKSTVSSNTSSPSSNSTVSTLVEISDDKWTDLPIIQEV